MLRSLMTVSGFTLISRLLGFARDILIARFLGTGLMGDAFFAAFRFPNLFRRIFGEGAFNAAFVPLFGKKVADEPVEGMRFASQAFSMLLAVLGVLTLIAIPLMPWIMGAVVPGFKALDADPSFIGKKSEVQLVAKEQEFSFQTKGARAMYVDVVKDGQLVMSEVSFQKEEKSLGSFFGKEGKKTTFTLSAPLAGGVVPTEKYQTVLGPLEVVIPKGLNKEEAQALREKRESEISAIKKSSFVVEGAKWIDGGFSALPGVDFVKITRPTGKAGKGLEHFTLKMSGDAKVKNFRNHPQTFEKTVKLSRICFIYLLCMSLAAHLSGVLNTFRVFGMPAAAPIILNVVFLAGLGGVYFFGWMAGETLAWSVTIAGFLQLAALWVTCLRNGASVRIVKPQMTTEMKNLFGLMGPGVASASVQQINLLIGGIIASFQPGAVSYLYYSDRVYQLPLGMIGIALGVVLLPEVTRQLQGGMERQAGKTIARGIELGLLLTLPAAVAMMVVPTEIIAGLFERGEFVRADSAQTGLALAAFGAGLPGYVLIKILQPGYFAKGDTKNPMKMAVIMVIVNVVVSLILFPWIGHVGLAVATSVAAWVNVILLWRGLNGFVVMTESTLFKLGRMVCASVLMGVVLFFAAKGLASWFDAQGLMKVIALGLLVGTGASAFGALALFLGATSVKDLKSGFGRG